MKNTEENIKRILKKSPFFYFFIIFIFSANKGLSQDYIWPTNASRYLTSTFCEYRGYHFHSGIDIKTWAKTGYKVFAVDSGSLWRLKVSPYGYGKVLYIHHNDGKYSVYGHLLKFSDKIQNLVKEEQKRLNRFSIEIFFQDGKIPIKKGELIGYTGRSAAKSPHLHFEIRDANHNPLNPNIYGFKVNDSFSPIVKSVSFSPLDYNSFVENDYKPFVLPAQKVSEGKFNILETVEIWGNIGIGVSVYDMDGNVTNKYDPFFIDFFIDDEEVFKVKYDKFSFDETREIILDRDFRLLKRGFGIYNKLYRDIGNNLKFYDKYKTYDGVVRAFFSEHGGIGEGEHSFRIVIGDVSGNISVCSGKFNAVNHKVIDVSEVAENDYSISSGDIISKEILYLIGDLYDNYLRLEINSLENLKSNPEIEVYNNESFELKLKSREIDKNIFVCSYPLIGESIKNLHFIAKGELYSGNIVKSEYFIKLFPVSKKGGRIISENRNCILEFPKESVYNKFWGRITELEKKNSKDSVFIGNIYSLEPFDIPLNNRAKLFIRYPDSIANPEKFGIYSFEENNHVGYSKSKLNSSFSLIESNINELGRYTLIKDTEPPVIYKIIPRKGTKIKNRTPKITVYFNDELSGIESDESIILKLDGKRVISEYDPIMENVFYIPEDTLSYGEHIVEFEVVDNMNNKSYIKSVFSIIP